jgi:hypothetical protein
MSKQTAVEWLINELHRKQNGCGSELSFNHIFDKAKEMEREQIEESFKHGKLPHFSEDLTAEEYYTQTYGGSDEQQV